MIRVCLVDDQTLVRQGIRSLLALDDGIEVVAEAADGRQAVELIPQIRPDVVLMDMRMPVMSGLEALQVLSRQEQLPPTIILTTFDDDQLVLAGLKAGAKGYLLKDVTLEQLVGAIRTVADGGSLVLSGVLARQADEVAAAYAPFIKLGVWAEQDGWVALHGTLDARVQLARRHRLDRLALGLGLDAIPRSLCLPGKGLILVEHLMRIAADPNVGPAAVEHLVSIGRSVGIVVMLFVVDLQLH